nr:MAG TPA: hypothetical protein [Caudoviricetes sp.]DAW92056.1 MAG TPA: hypothetical protein [Bacteriophage sp.]
MNVLSSESVKEISLSITPFTYILTKLMLVVGAT